MVLVCCFCDKIRDQSTQSLWHDLQAYEAYTVSRNVKREDTILSYTCCRDCLQDDPRAITFRTRRSHSRAPSP